MTPGIGAMLRVSVVCLSVTACAEGASNTSPASFPSGDPTELTVMARDIGGFKLDLQSIGNVDRGAVALEVS